VLTLRTSGVTVLAVVLAQNILEDPLVDNCPTDIAPGFAKHAAAPSAAGSVLFRFNQYDCRMHGTAAKIEQQVNVSRLNVRPVP
jgi:hypothetical protein